MPPVLAEAQENIEILEKDDMLSGFSKSKHLFIDISLGIPIRVCQKVKMISLKVWFLHQDRLIVARDVDGTLRTATLDEKRRIRQVYFPISGRELIMPKMFEENHLEVKSVRKLKNNWTIVSFLQKILENNDYEFVLDRACIQFEPDEQDYIRVEFQVL